MSGPKASTRYESLSQTKAAVIRRYLIMHEGTNLLLC